MIKKGRIRGRWTLGEWIDSDLEQRQVKYISFIQRKAIDLKRLDPSPQVAAVGFKQRSLLKHCNFRRGWSHRKNQIEHQILPVGQSDSIPNQGLKSLPLQLQSVGSGTQPRQTVIAIVVGTQSTSRAGLKILGNNESTGYHGIALIPNRPGNASRDDLAFNRELTKT